MACRTVTASLPWPMQSRASTCQTATIGDNPVMAQGFAAISEWTEENFEAGPKRRTSARGQFNPMDE